jgi:hypothetical protein
MQKISDNRKMRFWLCLTGLISVIVMLLTAGCAYSVSRSSDQYNSFTLRKGIARCSFEYNNIYKVGMIETKKDYSRISLQGPFIGEAQDFNFISIYVNNNTDGKPDYKKAIDHMLDITNLPDFQILERYPVRIFNEPGEEVIYYFVAYHTSKQVAEGIAPTPSITYYVAFVHDELLWTIVLNGLDAFAEADRADFDHLLQTFKVLD